MSMDIFEILIIHKPSSGSREVPQKNLGLIGSGPFWRLLDTNNQTWQAKFIYRWRFNAVY